jgi:hypothetical protein
MHDMGEEEEQQATQPALPKRINNPLMMNESCV